MKRILLIDLSGIYWPIWHATADQAVSEAFERTVAKVASLSDGYDHVAVCCDHPPYFRKEIYPEYKAQREAAPPAAVEQFRRVKDRLRADGHLLWDAKGFEADDLIATAVGSWSDGEITIASADKDLLQLVGSGVRVVSTMTGAVFDGPAVFEKFGVTPRQMADFLALVGDASDNIPGVPGIGGKTASALLAEFGDLESVLAEAAKPPPASDADESGSRITKPKLKAALIEHAGNARVCLQLTQLRRYAPIKFSEIFEEREAAPLTDETEMEEMEEEPSDPQEAAAEPVAAQASAPSTELAIRTPSSWALALEPSSSKSAWAVAGALHSSRLYQHLGSQAAIYAVLLRGRAIGLDATTALAVFHNLKGKLTMHADLIEALVLRSGKAEYFEMVESTAKIATYATKRVGSRREQSISFAIEDAWRASLVSRDERGQDGFLGISESGKPSNWDKYRATMLRHRAKTQLARAVYIDVVLGLYSPDEVSDGAEFGAQSFEVAA